MLLTDEYHVLERKMYVTKLLSTCKVHTITIIHHNNHT